MDTSDPTIWAQIQPALVTALLAAVAALVGVATHALQLLATRARQWLESKSEDARWRAAIAKLDEAAVAGMQSAEQTIAKRLREIVPVGKLDADQAKLVLADAVAAARLHLGPTTMATILDTLELTPDRISDLLRTRIEAAIARSKGPASPSGITDDRRE